MSISSSLGPATLVGVSPTVITLAASACSPLIPEEDVVQSSAQSSAEGTDQSVSRVNNCRIIPLSGISPDTLEEFCGLLPETKTIPSDILLGEPTRGIEDAETMGIAPEEYFRNVIEAVRMNGEAMRGVVEEATGDAPAQSHWSIFTINIPQTPEPTPSRISSSSSPKIRQY